MRLGIANHLLGEEIPQTNEEYKKYLKRRFKCYILIFHWMIMLWDCILA